MYRPEQLELVARKLGELQMGLFASRAYLDSAGRPTTLQEIFEHPLIGYDRNEEIIRGMQDRGLPATRDWFAVRCDNRPVNWQLVRAGCGLGFGMSLAEADPAVEAIDLPIGCARSALWLVTHQALRQTPRIATVWQALVDGLKPLPALIRHPLS